MEIHNLTHEQVEMLDKLWTLESMEEIVAFKQELPLFRRQQVDTLLALVFLQSIDDVFDQHDTEKYPIAEKLIKKLRKKG